MNNRGLTLIELLLTLTISSIIGTAIVSFLISGLNHYNESQVKSGLHNELQFIESHLKDNIKNSRAIDFDSVNSRYVLTLAYTNRNEKSYYQVVGKKLNFTKTENGITNTMELSSKIKKFEVITKQTNNSLLSNEVLYSVILEDGVKNRNVEVSIINQSILLPDWR
ncbi:prepilin-type N-terminal cleavage/methylation domain-containing protein [Bacillus tuaregi]|uniref:prepilin-type N-terminal cleavage/methylation domain-containing protein n=1 Tax=Bacillus tuaregi TaxID=1816695 RepID=UPI0008F7ED2D|nr:prepilin-type N-terminal cleavage/methylation domain-containing protein [Bacillus tuaregi]